MKNIVVAGGTKGIGKKLIQLLKDGNVFVVARSIGNIVYRIIFITYRATFCKTLLMAACLL